MAPRGCPVPEGTAAPPERLPVSLPRLAQRLGRLAFLALGITTNQPPPWMPLATAAPFSWLTVSSRAPEKVFRRAASPGRTLQLDEPCGTPGIELGSPSSRGCHRGSRVAERLSRWLLRIVCCRQKRSQRSGVFLAHVLRGGGGCGDARSWSPLPFPLPTIPAHFKKQ